MALADGLVGYWSLDEASGTRADAHGSNDLSDTGSVASAAGKISNGADFDGVDDKLVFATPLVLSGNRTIAFWFKVDTAVDGVILGGTGPADAGYYPYIQLVGGEFIYLRATGSGFATGIVLGAISTGVLYQIVITGDGTTASIYKNAVFLSTLDDRNPTLEAVGSFVNSNNSNFDGIVDELGYWNTIKSADEVTALYNGGAGLSYAAIIASGVPSVAFLPSQNI